MEIKIGILNMKIRKTTKNDIPVLMYIFQAARNIMRKSGNMNQWPVGTPSEETILNDIKNKNSYIVENDDGKIIATFAFIIGKDPTYSYIEGGKWLNDEPYGTIHRIASSGSQKGIMEYCLNYCCKYVPNIRIDTHEDNKIMQHLLEKFNFKYCGIIYLLDGNPRQAYQKIIR